MGENSKIEGRVQLGENVTLVNSLVRGPSVIGDDVRLENVFVGPYSSIGDRCVLTSCEIENSIILADSEISDLPRRVDSSLVGRGVKIRRSEDKPKAYRFMLGDNSEVSVG